VQKFNRPQSAPKLLYYGQLSVVEFTANFKQHSGNNSKET